jgi:1,4-dihydroxy-2-naphthoate octaprenyltransferase
MPVLAALALAWSDLGAAESGRFLIVPAICCLFFAVLGQAAANLFNDFSDYRTGANPTLRAEKEKDGVNRRGLFLAALSSFIAASIFGLATIPYGGWTIICVGLGTGAICFLYSVGPFPLSENGLGDVAVIVTFGLCASVFTYFLQTQRFSLEAFALGVVFGLPINNVLVANNYADRNEDRAINKHTTVALFGARFGRALFLVSGLVAAATLAWFYTLRSDWSILAALSIAACVAMTCQGYAMMRRPGYTKDAGLAQAGKCVTLLGVLVSLAILI